MHYLSYDIKGIQHFIYSIPRLKCMIGASSQIAKFDEKTVVKIADDASGKALFHAGGHGVIECPTPEKARDAERQLIEEAHKLGLDIRIGIEQNLSAAVRGADRLYAFLPQSESGADFPCSVSGLWPVKEKDEVHLLVRKRIVESKEDLVGKRVLVNIESELKMLLPAVYENYKLQFFRNVNPERMDDDDEDGVVDDQRAQAGFYSLGGRNRWAIIAMDGNDMGKQFSHLERQFPGNLGEKLEIVSESLTKITRQAFSHAIMASFKKWINDCKPILDKCWYDDRTNQILVLPFRPLICGGDDLLIITHCSLAMDFVQTMANEFTRLSREENLRIKNAHGFEPWESTGGSLTMSAGVLYVKSSLPLHTGIPYAESLLGNAKGRFRTLACDKEPTPAAVDWDVVTDTMIDTPAARRSRESVFIDPETRNCVWLTRRPYLLDQEGKLPEHLKNLPRLNTLRNKLCNKLKKLPNSFLSSLERELRKPWSDRKRFLITTAKDGQLRWLTEALDHLGNGTFAGEQSCWFPRYEKVDGEIKEKRQGTRLIQETDVLDAISLIAEEHRMSQGGAE